MAQPFDLGLVIGSMAAGTWRKATSDERSAAEYLERKHGAPTGDPNFCTRIPLASLCRRDLTAATASAGGYLVDSWVGRYAAALLPKSVTLRAGAQLVPVSGGDQVVPVGTGAATTTWLQTEATPATESTPVIAGVSARPKTLSAYTEVSRQLLLQSTADAVIRTELANAVASALDAAILNGSGTLGQPLGIIGTPGIGSVTGISLGHAGLADMQLGVLTANAGNDPTTCAYIAPPAIAKLLNNRQRFTGSDAPLWAGALGEGTVEGVRGFSTMNAPTATMLYGDFSRVDIMQWAAAELMVDPFTKMQAAIIGVRLMLSVDIVVRHPAAFSLATGVT